MYKYIKNKEINYSLWDKCIHNSPMGNVYALSWFLDIVSPGWDALIKKDGNSYVAVFPLPVIKKWNLKYLSQPLFTQQLGFFHLTSHNPTPQDYRQFHTFIDKEYDLISGYNFNIDNELNKNSFTGFQYEFLKTYQLDLSFPYKAIWSNYKKDKKARVEQAKKLDISIYPSINVHQLMGLFNEYIAYKIPGVKDNDSIYHTLEDIFQEAYYHKMVKLFEVKNKKNKCIAMALFLIFKKKIIYFFSALTPEGKEKKAMIFLIDHVIEQYSQKDYVLDFEGSHVPGIAEFYRSFGAEKKEFLSVSKNNLPTIVKSIKKFKSLIQG